MVVVVVAGTVVRRRLVDSVRRRVVLHGSLGRPDTRRRARGAKTGCASRLPVHR